MFHNRSRYLIAVFSIVLTYCLGCGTAELPYTDNSKDSIAFSKTIKELVLNTVERTKKSSAPADAIRGIVLAVSELDACPVGEHMDKFKKIHTIASGLLAECEKGKPANLEAKLGELAKIAESLPGEVKLEKEKGND